MRTEPSPPLTPLGDQPSVGTGLRDAWTHGRPYREGTGGRGDQGSATVVGAVAVLAMLSIVVVVVQLGAAAIARHRAGSAADLAALAGASVAVRGTGVACGRAAELVVAGGARLESCRVDGLDVLVTVSVGAGLLNRRANARARAGPDFAG